MDTNIALQTLDALQASGEALKAAKDLAEAVDREKQAAHARIAPTIDGLLNSRLIEDHERTGAFQKLSSHTGALEIVGNLLTHLSRVKAAYEQKLKAAGQGLPVSEKTAGVGGVAHSNGSGSRLTSNSAPIVGRPAGLGEKRGSDLAFLKGLGLESLVG